jgi:hypothetical protein
LDVADNRQTASMDNDTFDPRTFASLPIRGVNHVGHVARVAKRSSSIRPQSSIRASNASIMPASPECSSALRFGVAYCASSGYI